MSPGLISQILTPKFNPHQIRLFQIYFWNILVRVRSENWVLIQESRSGVPWSPSCSCHIINYFMWGSLEVLTVIEFGVQMFIGISFPVWSGRGRSWIVMWIWLGSANLGVSETHDNPGWSQFNGVCHLVTSRVTSRDEGLFSTEA